jgi:hypothetical protein
MVAGSATGASQASGVDKASVGEQAKPAGVDRLVPNARLSGYQVEAAELLAGAAARRKRRAMTASGLPAPDPATQEPPIKMTRPPRPGSAKPSPKG